MSYRILYRFVDTGDVIGTAYIVIDATTVGLDVMEEPYTYKIRQNTPASYAVIEALEEWGYEYEYSGSMDVGFYLRRISRGGMMDYPAIPENLWSKILQDGLTLTGQTDNNSLGEFDYTQGSGWMYSVGGNTYAGKGLSGYYLTDGDTLYLRFTLAYGKDIGGYSSTGGSYGLLPSYCGKWLNGTYIEEHVWGEPTQTVAPDCTHPGEISTVCTVCGDRKDQQEVPPLGHDFVETGRTEPGEDGTPGYIEYTCMVGKCGATFRHTLPATGQHTWNEGVVTKEPTCTELGVRTFTCTVCHNTRTEDIEAPGHEYGEWVIDRDATCVEEGSKHRDCIRGDDTQTEVIPVSKTHTFGEWVITKEPTCTEKGERQHSCTISGCVVTETEELPALGHQWSDWTPVKGDSSREYRICEVCNEVEYRDVSHNSDSSISTGLRVLDPAQTNIIQNVQLVQLSQINHTLYIYVAQETASLQGDLSDLIDLRSENIETVVFSTESCTSTLSLSDVAALGAGSTPFILSHSGSTATFTVGGADHTALLR